MEKGVVDARLVTVSGFLRSRRLTTLSVGLYLSSSTLDGWLRISGVIPMGF